jgi:hypothetical protein
MACMRTKCRSICRVSTPLKFGHRVYRHTIGKFAKHVSICNVSYVRWLTLDESNRRARCQWEVTWPGIKHAVETLKVRKGVNIFMWIMDDLRAWKLAPINNNKTMRSTWTGRRRSSLHDEEVSRSTEPISFRPFHSTCAALFART